MKVAVCQPAPSAVADLIEGELEGLRAVHDVDVLGPNDLADFHGKDHERLLIPIANDPACAPFLPLLRDQGGCIWLRDWSLRSLMEAARPALANGGFAARIAAWREGGLGGTRSDSPLNRSVVRFGDGYLVADAELRSKILADRNAPTPVALYPEDGTLAELVEAMPAHRAAKKSLIQTAIEYSDKARAEKEERLAEEKESEERGRED